MHQASAITRAICLCFFLFSGYLAAAQNFRDTFQARNAVYVELGGNGDAYSLNFDRIVYQKAMIKAALRAGISTNISFFEGESGVYPIVPVEVLGMMGRYQKHLEVGLGYTRRFTGNPDLLQDMYFSRIGFRYQSPQGGLLVRVALTPFLSTEINRKTPGPALVPRFGLSIGHSF